MTHIIVDDFGLPTAVADMGQIERDATLLAYRMAARCENPLAMNELACSEVVRIGEDGFGYVAAAALRILAEHILAPTLEVSRQLGVDLTPGLYAALQNAEHTLA